MDKEGAFITFLNYPIKKSHILLFYVPFFGQYFRMLWFAPDFHIMSISPDQAKIYFEVNPGSYLRYRPNFSTKAPLLTLPAWLAARVYDKLYICMSLASGLSQVTIPLTARRSSWPLSSRENFMPLAEKYYSMNLFRNSTPKFPPFLQSIVCSNSPPRIDKNY